MATRKEFLLLIASVEERIRVRNNECPVKVEDEGISDELDVVTVHARNIAEYATGVRKVLEEETGGAATDLRRNGALVIQNGGESKAWLERMAKACHRDKIKALAEAMRWLTEERWNEELEAVNRAIRRKDERLRDCQRLVGSVKELETIWEAK
eukprot:CAMPEP_0184686174 /NCGR_PEP_ID=MMETSP0312-20130426/21524_1 /TAXON_ID=31354 /ORGANISM="Compsopogon coeruleus, Strain SAG 36.94" /LENGTH=153 /DNA_ID=CAMNT_0027140995 /DNA_START=9 /DNA_END=470 /DNA_ORIENTATION=-